MRTRISLTLVVGLMGLTTLINSRTEGPSAGGEGFAIANPIGASSLENSPTRSVPISESTLVAADNATRTKASENYRNLPLSFEANHGQTDGRVKFLSRGSGYSLYVNSTEAVFRLRNERTNLSSPELKAQSSVLRMQLVEANSASQVVGLDEMPGGSNYFIGNDPRKWKTNVSNYARVECRQVYPGIDMIYYGTQRQLEYDFKVAPGADPGRITITFDGASSIRVDERGDLMIDARNGRCRQHRPVVYQEIDGSRREVAGWYVVDGNKQVRFGTAAYDPSKTLVIDPVLVYSTYLGGSSDDTAFAISVDSSGNSYVTGFTYDFPTTPGAFQPGFGGGGYDAFVTKLNATGSAPIYSTYIGGGGIDSGVAIAVDSSDNVYVAGLTASADFPTTPGAFQATLRSFDAFVLKLNATGDALVYSSYLGGRDFDTPYGIAVDSSNNAYIAGFTRSDDFPTTLGAFQTTYPGGVVAFITKFSASGTKLAYSTYLGQINSGVEEATPSTHGKHIAVDGSGNAYVTGFTSSPDFPVTPGAFQVSKHGGNDAFVTKLNQTGTALVYSTFLGGNGGDFGGAIAIDSSGDAYVTGDTSSNDFPVTGDCLQSALKNAGDVFVTKFDATGTTLIYSTYLGGSNSESAGDISVDYLGNAYVTGSTTSFDFPLAQPLQPLDNSSTAYKSTDGGDSWNVIRLNPTDQLVAAWAIDPVTPSNIYAGSAGGIYKSTDGGKTWKSPHRNIPHISGISQRNLVIDPKTPTTLYVGTLPDGVFKSTDGGDTWNGVGPPRTYVNGLAIDPINSSTIYAGVLIDFGGGVYKSTDAGGTWTFIALSDERLRPSINVLAIDPTVSSVVYAGAEDGVYKSTDSGTNWSAASHGLPGAGVIDLVIDPRSSSTLYVNTGGSGIFKSTDSGNTWQPSGLAVANIATLAIDALAPSTLYAGTLSGLYASTNGGASWSRKGLVGNYALALAVDPAASSTVYAGVSLSSEVFVAKLNITGKSLIYSTYLGGTGTDNSYGIAVDSTGNAYVAGGTSTNFPSTEGALKTTLGGNADAFIAKIRLEPPRIADALLNGKSLIVHGENFDNGALVLLDGERQKTKNDVQDPNRSLIAKKAGKRIGSGQTVAIQVRNSDGTLSTPFIFTRAIN